MIIQRAPPCSALFSSEINVKQLYLWNQYDREIFFWFRLIYDNSTPSALCNDQFCQGWSQIHKLRNYELAAIFNLILSLIWHKSLQYQRIQGKNHCVKYLKLYFAWLIPVFQSVTLVLLRFEQICPQKIVL